MEPESYKEAILHIDGDSFFAACEVSLNPWLRGKPVVTGEEKGIATAMTQEAKAIGIHRGMPVFKIRKAFPEAIILPGDYQAYALFAKRMYAIVGRYAVEVEPYSIDECFARIISNDPIETAQQIKAELQKELGMTFSLGIAPTKSLAKVASKTQKPNGFTVLTKESIPNFLKELSTGSVWGIGPQTAMYLRTHAVRTALEYTEKSREWVEHFMAKPHQEIWHELRGDQVFDIHSGAEEPNKSISRTRTFTPPTHSKEFLLSQLSNNAEAACNKARREGLKSKRAYCYVKTQEFRYHRFEIGFDHGIDTPELLLKEIRKGLEEVYKPEIPYRASGVVLAELSDSYIVQDDLFGLKEASKAWSEVYRAVDRLEKRYGEKRLFLGSSQKALRHQKSKEIKNRPIHFLHKIKIPWLGEVK